MLYYEFRMGESPVTHSLSRRDFIKAITAGVGTLISTALGIPAIGFLISPALHTAQMSDTWIPLWKLENYPIGIPIPFSFTQTSVNGWEKTANSYGVFVLRKDEKTVKVLSNVCTHLGCRVSWHPDLQEYVSPCHDGHFDIDGNVTKGPPPRPLDQYEVKIEDGNLFLHLTNG